MHWFFDWNPRHAKRDCRLHPDFLRTDALTSLFTFFGLALTSLFTFFGLEDACLSQLHPSKKYWFFSSLVMSCRGCKRERDGSCGKWNISARRHSEHLSYCNPLHVGAILRDVHCGIELLDCGSIKILLEFREGHNCQKEESLLWVHLAFLHAPSSPTSHFQIPSWSRLNDMYQIEVAFRIWDQNRTAITFHDQTNGKMQWIKTMDKPFIFSFKYQLAKRGLKKNYLYAPHLMKLILNQSQLSPSARPRASSLSTKEGQEKESLLNGSKCRAAC